MIQVFSTMKNKPHHYRFTDLTKGTDENGYGFNPIEFSISTNGKDWVSLYDVQDLEHVLCIDTPYVAETKQTDTTRRLGLNDGQQLLSTSYEQRELEMQIVFYGLNQQDTSLAYDALQRFLVSRTPYWICFDKWPQRMYYVKATQLEQTHMTDMGFVSKVTFQDQIGLSRSIGTTADWGNAVIGFGNNQPVDTPQYSFNTNHFTVKNLSDVRVDPERRGHQFKMTLKGNSGGKLKVTNKTTKESISREKAFNGTFELNGVNPLLDGKGDLLNTDYGVITLQKGDNEFEVENFNGTIGFDFPMWWLS